MKKNLMVIGPYDRYNYGDLLFPYMIEKELSEYYETINFYGLIESDLSYVGGKKTRSIRQMRHDLKKIPNCHLIIAGGESLFAEWNLLYSFLSPKWIYFYRLYRIIRRIIGNQAYFVFEFIIRKILGGKGLRCAALVILFRCISPLYGSWRPF